MTDLAAERARFRDRYEAQHLEVKARRVLERAGWGADSSRLAEAVQQLYPAASFDVLAEAERLQEVERSRARHVAPEPSPRWLWPDVKRATCAGCGREVSTWIMNALGECEGCAEVAA